jgi:hypothetical protein
LKIHKNKEKINAKGEVLVKHGAWGTRALTTWTYSPTHPKARFHPS